MNALIILDIYHYQVLEIFLQLMLYKKLIKQCLYLLIDCLDCNIAHKEKMFMKIGSSDIVSTITSTLLPSLNVIFLLRRLIF